jgi:Fusaric acid resistance protein-like
VGHRWGHLVAEAMRWLDVVDPAAHRRIKGLRLVTAYAIAALLGATPSIAGALPDARALAPLAGAFALWASVSEGRATRADSSRDLALLAAASAFGAASFVCLAPLCLVPELVLVTGAFFVGYLKGFGITGAGLGSQIYIGQLLAYSSHLGRADLPTIAVAGLLAALAAVVPRVLSGPAEHPTPFAPLPVSVRALRPELIMGLQAAVSALVIVALNVGIGLIESAWAITAATYVVAGSASGTADRVRRRIVGTLVGVPLGLACLPLAEFAPLLLWAGAALAMVIYAMALPEHYEVACGAFAFVLIATLAVNGEHAIAVFASRAWETLLGGALGLAAATFLLPLRPEATGHRG